MLRCLADPHHALPSLSSQGCPSLLSACCPHQQSKSAIAKQ
uniref:Uncharacterized protein n=1 Tax=Arundo donax TaxID=35708 RepID=A0A0A8Y9V1_ARUDO